MALDEHEDGNPQKGEANLRVNLSETLDAVSYEGDEGEDQTEARTDVVLFEMLFAGHSV